MPCVETHPVVRPPGEAPRRGNADRLLLIVQGNALLCSALARFFSTIVDVASFSSPYAADRYLSSVSRMTYILIGQSFFGDESGADWVGLWRRCYPQVQRVVLTSGLDMPQAIEGVDAVVGKPFDVRLVAQMLALDEPAHWVTGDTHQHTNKGYPYEQ